MDVVVCKNYQELSHKAAMIFLNKLALKANSVFGLATGSTPVGMYEELIKNTKDYSYDWSKVKTFNLDEYYGLDNEHSQSYRWFMQKNLFKHINIKKSNIHIPDGKAKNVKQFCKDYEQLIKKNPIDIQLLGLGSNGHIAFNEPGCGKDSKTRLIDLSKSTIEANARFFKNEDQVPSQAITMGVSTILKAKKIVIMANGEKKAKAVRNMIEGKIGSSCPASWLRLHPRVTVIVDEEAASLLKGNYKPKKTGWSSLRLMNQRVVPKGKNILVISPHHDDSAVSAGATIKGLSGYNKVYTLVMTAGYRAEMGNLNNKEKIKIRDAEAKAENRILGSQLILNQFKFYEHDKKFWRGDLIRLGNVFRKIKPEIILLPHKYDEHHSHRLATELVLDYLKEKRVRGVEIWYYEGLWSQHILNKVDLVFGFDKKLLLVKNKAMRVHKSQIKRLPILAAADALACFRAKTIPEQLFVAFGGNPPKIADYAEVYDLEIL